MLKDPMVALPPEVTTIVLSFVDVLTLMHARRIAKHWKALIDDSGDDIWRGVALHLGLTRTFDADLPPSIAAPQEQPLSKFANEAIMSTTGYFEELKSFRNLCYRYARLAVSWNTSGIVDESEWESPTARIWPTGCILEVNDQIGHRIQLSPDTGSVEAVTYDWEDGVPQASGTVRSYPMKHLTSERTEDARSWTSVQEIGRGPSLPPFAHLEGDAGYLLACAHDFLDSIIVWKKSRQLNAYEEVGSLVTPHGMGHPRASRFRYPTCVAATLDRESKKWFIVGWDVTRLAVSFSFPLDPERGACEYVELDGKGMIFVCHAIGFAVYSLKGETQLWMGFKLISKHDDGSGYEFKHWAQPAEKFGKYHVAQAEIQHALRDLQHVRTPLEWSVEEDCCRAGSSQPIEENSLATILLCQAALFSRSIHPDTKTDTLVVGCDWGLILLRPYSALAQEHSKGVIEVARIGLQDFLPRFINGFGEPPNQRYHMYMAVSDGRVCYGNYDGRYRSSEDTFIIDLATDRLNPSQTAGTFENVKVWHWQARQPEENDELLVSCLQMDASGVYVCRPADALVYSDFGMAAKCRPDDLGRHAKQEIIYKETEQRVLAEHAAIDERHRQERLNAAAAAAAQPEAEAHAPPGAAVEVIEDPNDPDQHPSDEDAMQVDEAPPQDDVA
ncbi:hypothetical protein IE81DRAFT_326837 [Ceraceosorus guamensis]|uniref:F-box domain-containing protein n=1 Tax=Ceraceosorus guamensis TaxID=1522189 RepID=A0A316VRV8_9BASI|nr:hypothetical protein IE81DRAFT_326837 [Ceraceosorus guamensis]PWN39143.1 hypothetical protein IE81DRAFT_326837 [Ceraceosorus guamensis]